MPNSYAKYIAQKYHINEKNINLFAPFVVKAYRELLNINGLMGLLIPKVFIKNTSYADIRKEIIDNFWLYELCDFGQFPGVASDCVVPFISKEKTENKVVATKIFECEKLAKTNSFYQALIQESPIYAFSLGMDNATNSIIKRVVQKSNTLDKVCTVKRGIELGQNAALVKCETCGGWNEAGEKYYHTSKNKTCRFCKSRIKTTETTDISRSSQLGGYKLKCVSGKSILQYDVLSHYFIKTKLKGIDYKEDIFRGDRIYIKRIAQKIEGTFFDSSEECSAFNTVYSLCNFNDISPKFVLGVLNSKLCHFFYEKNFNLGMRLTTQITIEYLKQIPIPKINFNNEEEALQYEQIITFVNGLLREKQQLHIAYTQKDINYYSNQCAGYATKINSLVYQLYGLTPAEIAIVEI